MKFRALTHDYAKARREAGPNRVPALGFSDGTRHALLPHGQHVNIDESKNLSKAERKAAKRHKVRLRRHEEIVRANENL